MPIDSFGVWWQTAGDAGFNTGVEGPNVTAALRPQYERDLAEWQAIREMARMAGRPLRRAPAQAGEAAPAMDPNRGYLDRYPRMDLTKIKEADTYSRGVNLQPFKVDYDTHEQISQKLQGSVILVKGWPFTVQATIHRKDGGFALLLGNQAGNLSWVNYEDVSDFRSLAPGYVNYNTQSYWVYRIPDRQNTQGMTQRNTYMKPAGDGRTQGMNTAVMLSCLANRKNIPFQPNLIELIESGVFSSVRLSNNLALHRVKTKGAIAGVEYIGRPFGLLVDGRVKVLDDADLGPTWIHKDCFDVNLELF